MQTTRVLEETVVRFSESYLLPQKPSAESLYNWRTKGVIPKRQGKYYGAPAVTLEWACLGGRPVTSQEAFARFLKRINGEEEEEF